MNIGDIKKRCEAATPGPWASDEDPMNDVSVWAGEKVIICNVGPSFVPVCPTQLSEMANAEFIAHAREDIPALLAEIARLRDALRDAKSALEDTSATIGWRIDTAHVYCRDALAGKVTTSREAGVALRDQ